MSYVAPEEGNFYSTGEYAKTVDFFDIHGVSFNQKVDSVKHLLDSNTLQILKVLLTDNDAPVLIDYKTELDIVYLLESIQSRLSNDNKHISESIPKGDDE